jgi:hypothetical protein
MTETQTQAPAPADGKAPKHPAGPKIIPLRGKALAKDETGEFAVVKVLDSPWIKDNPGVTRIVRGLKAAKGKKLHLYHGKTGIWQGEYVVIAAP